MKFSVSHITQYHYSKPVWDSFNDAHLCPSSDALQECVSFDLSLIPSGGPVLRRLDFYTNQVHHFEVMAPHDSLRVEAISTVETHEDTRDRAIPSPVAALAGLDRDERFYDFLSASPRIGFGPMWSHEAKEITLGLSDVRLQAEAVMVFVYKRFEYAAGSTHVDSTIDEVFATKRGVCQDFAHIMIALCRGLRIPTRYVSGYFHLEAPSSAAVDNTHASHAWVECYFPGVGWIGLDPTHNRYVTANYVKVAVGRDYSDVRPLAGTYRGDARAQMEVSVVVNRIDGALAFPSGCGQPS